MKRWLISVAAAVAITAGSTIAASPALAAAPGPAFASAHRASVAAASDFCNTPAPKKKTPSRPFNNLDWMRFGYLLVAAPAKDSDLCPILA